MTYDLIFLLEEPSAQNVLEILLPKIIPDDISFKCIPHQCKQDLQQSIPRKIKAFQNFSPKTRFIILHDQDSNDCHKLKAELRQLCERAGAPQALIRIVCRELESWFLGDLAALETAYGVNPNTLRKKQNNQKYRDPDRLNSAKQELKSLVRIYYPGTDSKRIALYLSLDENRSYSFRIFMKSLRQLCEHLQAEKWKSSDELG